MNELKSICEDFGLTITITLHKLIRILPFISVTVILFFSSQAKLALATSESGHSFDKGREIINQSEANTTGFRDMSSLVRMTLTRENGSKKVTEMVVKVISLKNGEGKSLTRFTKPKREKGISLLTFSHAKQDDEQWIYLPSTKRIKKIASSSKSSSFRGSDFSFEDLGSQSSSDFNFELLQEEPCDKESCWVLERTAIANISSYSKTHLWIDKVHFRLYKALFFGSDDKPMKQLTISNYKLHDDKFWKPELLLMKQSKGNRSTTLKVLEVQFNSNLQENEFSELSLKRGR